MYYLIAFASGLLNTMNRMTNVKAGRVFGTANGALINYGEATVLSLILIVVMGNKNELALGHIASAPRWVYCGGICGLLAMLAQIVGTLRTNALISSVLMLAGNLGISVVLDWFFYGNFHWVKILGIFLVLVGMTWIQKGKQTAQAEGLPAEG